MAVFITIETLGSQFIWFPAGVAKAYPVQHAVNVMAAILLGPGPAVIIACMIGLLRNILGLGTILAFPGGMIGAWLAGFLYRKFKRPIWATIGESIGTGLLAALFAVPYGKLLMGTSVRALFFIPSFVTGSMTGAIICWMIVVRIKQTNVLHQLS